MDSLRPGATLRKKFLIESEIGRGGMGTVYKAVHIRMRTRVAIKVLHRQHVGNPTHIQRFEREALAAARLRGSFAVRVFDVDTAESGEPFLVMELLRGRALSQVIGDNSTPRETLIDWAIQICSAIHEAHELGIVHRDLKPANIFVLDESNQIKVVDFGISQVRDTAELTSDSEVVGTPQYMSPEQLLSGEVGPASDIWSMGVVLYRLLARAHPMPVPPDAAPFLFAASTLTQEPVPILEHCPHLPEPLADAIMRCLEKQPEDRIGSARELADRLRPFGSGKVDFEVARPRALDSLPTLPGDQEASACVEEPLMPSGAPTAVEARGASRHMRLPSAEDAVVDELALVQPRRVRVLWAAAIGLVIVVGAVAYALTEGRGRAPAEGAPAALVDPEPAARIEPTSGESAIVASAGAASPPPATARSADASAPSVKVNAPPTDKPPVGKPPVGKPPTGGTDDNPWYL